MAKTSVQARVVSPRTLDMGVRKALSSSWKNAAGVLRHHKKGLDRYVSRVRKEWK